MKKILKYLTICFVGFLLIGLTSCGHEHTVILIPEKEATCLEAGLTAGQKCSTCDKILVEQKIIPIQSHSYIDGYCYLCDKEDPNISAFDKLKNHIKKNGNYSSGEYTVDMKETASDYAYLVYNVIDNTIEIGLYRELSFETLVYVIIDSSMSGYYKYGYIDGYDNIIKGNLVSDTFTSTTTLNYTYADYEGPLATFKKLIASLIYSDLLQFDIYAIEEGLDLSAKDFGFNSYE